MLGLGLSIPQVAARRMPARDTPAQTAPFFGSTTQYWGDSVPAFGKVS